MAFKTSFEKPKNAPKAIEGNLPSYVKGKGKFNKLAYSDNSKLPVSSMPSTKKELAKMRREKSKKDAQSFKVPKGNSPDRGGKLGTSFKPFG